MKPTLWQTKYRGNLTAQKLPLLHVIYRAVREVAAPVVSDILIITIVFIPLLALEGLEGKLFIPVALTIVFALLGSLILSLTAIPVFASLLMRRAGAVHHEPWLVRKLNALYAPSLHWALANTRTAIVAALLLLAPPRALICCSARLSCRRRTKATW